MITHDIAKEGRLRLRLDALRAASTGLSVSVSEAADHARAAKAEALRLSPIAWSPAEPLPELAGALRAEHDRLLRADRVNPAHLSTCRAGLVAADAAVAAAERVVALTAERARIEAELGPLQALLRALDRYLGRTAAGLPKVGEQGSRA